MPHIQKIKRKGGTAHRVHWSIDGLPHDRYFPPRVPFRDVKRFADTIIASRQPEPTTAPLHLGALLARYIAGRQHEHDCWREAVAMRHLVRFAGDIPAARVTAELLHRFRDALLVSRTANRELDFAGDQRIRRGVNHDLRHLRIVFRWAYRRDLVSVQPFAKVEMFKAAPPQTDNLTAEEMRRFFRALPKPDRMIAYLLRYTGLRVGEACAVRCEDVDLDNCVIRLQKTKNRDVLEIGIDGRLARIWRATKWLDGREWLVGIKPQTVSRHFRDAMEAAGMDKRMPTHIFRHTAARRIMEAYWQTGNAQEIARKFLRHKTRVMTDHYAKVYQEDVKRAMKEVKL